APHPCAQRKSPRALARRVPGRTAHRGSKRSVPGPHPPSVPRSYCRRHGGTPARSPSLQAPVARKRPRGHTLHPALCLRCAGGGFSYPRRFVSGLLIQSFPSFTSFTENYLLFRLFGKSLRLRHPAVKLCNFTSGNRPLRGKFRFFALAQIRFTLATALAVHAHRREHRKRTVVARQLHKTVQVYLTQEPNVIKM